MMARKIWTVLSRESPDVICLSADCCEHLSHLITLQGLKAADCLLKRRQKPWKFFASLATCCNTVRDLSKQFFVTWSHLHGDQSAMKCAKKLWPKCIGGRWNSVFEVVTRMVAVGGQSMFLPVIEDVLQKKDAASALKPDNDNHASRSFVDELSFEESKAYQRKMGWWRKRTLTCARDALWWVFADVMKISTDPLNHFSVARLHRQYCPVVKPITYRKFQTHPGCLPTGQNLIRSELGT